MYRKKEPKNENITIRATKEQLEVLDDKAKKNGLSRSAFGRRLLFGSKDNYSKSDSSIQEANLEDLKTALIHRILEKLQIRSLNNRVTVEEEIKQLKLAIKILNMTTFKSDEAIDELILISRCSVRSSVHRSQL